MMILTGTPEEREAQLYQINRENFARRHVAQVMELKDDPWGQKLTEKQWALGIPYAERRLAFNVETRSPGYNHVQISGTCPEDATVKEVEEYFYHDYFGGRGAWVDGKGRFGCIYHID